VGRIVGMDVSDVAFDIEVTFIDVVKLLFEVLVDEFIAI